jgi:hypothetical protein
MTVVAHISERPWSDYSESDYSIEQWHAACLIHLHTGPPTSKAQCKLPIKTPAGVINRNGVSAALAALHGARSALKAPPDQKAKAERRLQSLKAQLSSQKASALEHHGIKGMHWGVRRDRSRVRTSSDYKKTAGLRGKPSHELTDKQLRSLNERMNLEQNYSRLNPSNFARGLRIAGTILSTAGMVVGAYNLFHSPAGKSAMNVGRRLVGRPGYQQLKLKLK